MVIYRFGKSTKVLSLNFRWQTRRPGSDSATYLASPSVNRFAAGGRSSSYSEAADLD